MLGKPYRSLVVAVAAALALAGCAAQLPGSNPKTTTSPVVKPSISPSPTPSPSPTIPAGPAPLVQTNVDCKTAKCVALTFDDGPGPRTVELAELLAEKKIPATFFMLGRSIKGNEEAVTRVAQLGMAVGNHTINHFHLTKVSAGKMASEIGDNAAKIKELTGRTSVYLRPPYGDYNKSVLAAAKTAGEAVIHWNVDTLDWKSKDPDKIMELVKKETKAGSIILMHDIHTTSVDTVPRLLEWLAKEGYTVVTLKNLLGDPKPGVIYFGAPGSETPAPSAEKPAPQKPAPKPAQPKKK